jgi:hypothetical protein
VRDPADALAQARRDAAAKGAPDTLPPLGGEAVSARRLAQWAIIEPLESEVYSTRRFGRPITAVKRLLLRLMRQYFDQVTAQQSRFNAHLAAHVIALEDRVAALERATGTAPGEPDDGAPGEPDDGVAPPAR